jgi:hypothetical protein
MDLTRLPGSRDGRYKRVVFQRFALLVLVPGLALTALGQGISGVTRKTPTLEKQAAARRFLDSSGVLVTNGATTFARPQTSVGRPAIAVRPPPAPRTNAFAVRLPVLRTNTLPTTARSTRARVP